jgi:N-acetylmuramoyl-L-alanine amidase
MTLARCGVRISRKLPCLVLFTLFPFPSLQARQWDTQGAARAFEEARQKQSEIAQAAQPDPGQYLQCARAYRKVYLKSPHYGRAGDAIYEEGRIYQEMGDKFSDLAYYRTAVNRFHFLVKDYGHNLHCPDALLRMAAIYSKSLKDENAAQDAYQRLRTQYKYSSAALERIRKETASIPVEAQAAPVSHASASKPPAAGTASVQSIRYWSTSDYTRVIVDMDTDAPYQRTRLQDPDRLFLDISSARLSTNLANRSIAVEDELLRQIRVAQNRADVVRVVLDFSAVGDYAISELHDPFRIVIDLHRKQGTATELKPMPQASVPRSDEIAKTTSRQTPVASQVVQKATEPRIPSELQKASPSFQMAEPKAQNPPAAVTQIETPVSERAKPVPISRSSNAAKTQTPAASTVVKKTTEPPERSESGQTALMSSNGGPQRPPMAVTGIGSALPKETKPVSPSIETAGKPGEDKKADASTRSTPTIPPSISTAPKPSVPTSRGDRTLTRMLGLKIGRIVIDPGHGGHDLGTVGPGGLLEKNLVLSLALELQKQLQEKLGAEVILTREDDTFISLEERTGIANKHRADLFISIHANSSRQRSTSGVETYFLDFAKTESEREIAARENATTLSNVRDLEDLIKKIAKADKSAESRELASIVQKKLCSGLRRLFPSAKDRGVRSAPFVVLIGANMPSVLAEVAFISNPRDERLLKRKPNQELLAKALFSGIDSYMKTLGSDVVQNQASPK